jgi:hypothetical protein
MRGSAMGAALLPRHKASSRQRANQGQHLAVVGADGGVRLRGESHGGKPSTPMQSLDL